MIELAQSSEQEHLLAPLNGAIGKITPELSSLHRFRENELAERRPVSNTTVALAREVDSWLQTLGKAVAVSELAKKTKSAWDMHRWLSGLLGKYTSRVKSEREYCSRIMQDWNREQKAEAERAALKQEARQREFAAEHFPDMPIVVPHVEQPKLDGVSIRNYWTVGAIIDPVAFAKYLFANPHHLSGVKIELNKNYWKQFLNNRAGTETPEIPGLEIVQDGSTTNRGNGNG